MQKRYFLIGTLLILFCLITTLVLTDNISWFDDTIYNIIFGIRNNFFDFFFKAITILGNTTTIIIVVGLLLIFVVKEEYFHMLAISVVSTVATNQLLKHIFMRPRPDHLRLIKQGGYSYPSGHAMISIAIYGFLIYYIYKKVTNKKLKIFLISLLSLLIILIGLSRIYVGVHYPSDVLGGYILSVLILILVVLGVDKHVKNGSK